MEDDFHHEPTTTTSTTNEEQYLGGTSFQMPDNFDLPDEIIQEQLPKARYTSTPIRYAKVDVFSFIKNYLTFFCTPCLGFERR